MSVAQSAVASFTWRVRRVLVGGGAAPDTRMLAAGRRHAPRGWRRGGAGHAVVGGGAWPRSWSWVTVGDVVGLAWRCGLRMNNRTSGDVRGTARECWASSGLEGSAVIGVQSTVLQTWHNDAFCLRLSDEKGTPNKTKCQSGAGVMVSLVTSISSRNHADRRGDSYECAITITRLLRWRFASADQSAR